MGETTTIPSHAPDRPDRRWWIHLLFIGVLLAGAYFRFVGLNWDQNEHLHPDERFLTMVETSIDSVDSIAAYFDTATSSLNPHNRGYGFYVYGTLPLFVVRYAGEMLDKTGYDEIHLVGRAFSAAMDLGTVLLVYLIAGRLYRKRVLALFAGAFAAFSVLPIQLSHYFTVDTFTNFFGMLALYSAVFLLPARDRNTAAGEEPDTRPIGAGGVIIYVLFGVALGLAVASKVNAVFLAALLPGAALVRYLSHSSEERDRLDLVYLRNLAIAAVVSVIIFRIFQPYAFSGPGFFGLKPNPLWVDNIRSLAAQSTGDVDFPPALQWARRPLTFSLENMVIWGLGIPLGILAWAGFLYMGYRILRGEWREHVLVWSWTGLYFAYQTLNFVRSMRYQMLVYPTLAIIAAWVVFSVGSGRHQSSAQGTPQRWKKTVVLAGTVVLVLTAAWAYAFTRIYTRPVTRVEASRWIYQNVPGPINLHVDTETGPVNQPVAFRSGFALQPGEVPLVMAFQPRQSGEVTTITFDHLGGQVAGQGLQSLLVTLSATPDGDTPLASAWIEDTFQPVDDPRGKSYTASFDRLAPLAVGKTYYLVLTFENAQQALNISGAVTLSFHTQRGMIQQWLPEPVESLRAGMGYQINFTPVRSGMLREVVLEHVVDWEARPEEKTLRVSIIDPNGDGTPLAAAELRATFAAPGDIRGETYTFAFDQPVELSEGTAYSVRVEQVNGPGALAVYGSKQANESSWDDALPLSLDGYNPYDYYQGVYRSDLNFEMYWDDNADKLQRFLSILDQADTIFISSNRQWGTTTRVPERYPLTSAYYRALIGCPVEKEITWCYSVAEPAMFDGDLGFQLEAVFQSDPNLGSLRFNSQFAEEAFTVYDAPKVLIFKKTGEYQPEKVRAILSAVDLSTVIHITPRKAGSFPGNLLLPPDRLAGQRAGGTWAELFRPDALMNRYPAVAAVAWYLVVALLGIVVFPFTRLALRGLPDRGYPFIRLVGMLALAYPVWLLGSAGVPFTSFTISAVFVLLVLGNGYIAYRDRRVLAAELRERGRYYLTVELLILVFFLVFLFVRVGNPDLWHPWKGGEKPMDFSYFNAVLKSTTFPPYDPWFAGGYINYYYYGYVITGVPVKWLGIVPSIAYNLILPTLFAMLAAGAFSIGWNLTTSLRAHRTHPPTPVFGPQDLLEKWAPFSAGLFSALALTVVGNWGTVRMIWHGLQRLGGAGDDFSQAPLILHIGWTFQGLWQMVTTGAPLPYGASDWYWIPSRALPGWTITEFPAFTFLYGDLHAHMIALPITVLALGWAFSVLLGRWGWKGWIHLAASFLLGGLTIGALKPTNTWDWPTYLVIACVAVGYTALRYGQACCLQIPRLNASLKRVIIALVSVAALVLLSSLLYQPYDAWYGQGYNKIVPWTGDRSPFWSYMTHWGVLLFLLSSWMISQAIDSMAQTPLSALTRLRRYGWLVYVALAVLLLMIVGLFLLHVEIGWLVVLLMAFSGVLILIPGLHDAKRAVLFLTGTGLFLTLFVELARLDGDYERMNTVFKFYLQGWTLMTVSAGACLAWLLQETVQFWRPWVRRTWQPVLVVLLFGTALFPLMGGMDKIRDRMASAAPNTLDGMAYMAYATHPVSQTTMDLSEDERAIRWMQRNVTGSPVIVEANIPEYNWGNRFTVYTGLPGVVGWNWHQRQQRAVTPSEWVIQRVEAITIFYNSVDRAQVEQFIRKYDIGYIIVGQLERGLYTPEGLQKFSDWNGDLWREVYRDGQTVIYETMQ